MPPLRILVVATKAPWPPVDGGRLVLFNTIEALAAAGHEVDVVAPFPGSETERKRSESVLNACSTPHLVPARPRSTVDSVWMGLRRRMPITVARHALPEVAAAVSRVLNSAPFDVIHAEQLHTLPQLVTARDRGVPVVHRAHNLESLLWAYTAHHRGPLGRPFVALEARRMSDWEVRVLEETRCTVALTDVDRRAFSELVPGASVYTIPAPFPGELPADGPCLDGSPAVVTLASATWAPSRDAVLHLASQIWPTVRRRLPGAVLHVFGGGRRLNGLDGVVSHRPPADSRTAFPEEAIALIPERHPTGVPMKALEAWARGLPLLADGPTAKVLDAEDGVELVVARHAAGYAEALARLVEEDGLRKHVVDGGRRALAQRNDPAVVAGHLENVYRWAMESRNKPD